MASNTPDYLVFFASLQCNQENMLGHIRAWENVKVGNDEDLIWLKDLTEEQTNDIALRSIPNCKFYYVKDSKLFPKNSLLPSDNIPALLWTPIARALSINLPRHNNNMMGVGDDKVDIRLVTSSLEQEAVAMIVSCGELQQYVMNVSQIRLNQLKWSILENDLLFLQGYPLLPIQGTTYWRYKQLFLPTGFDLNFPILADLINDKYTTIDSYLCWLDSETYIRIDTNKLEDLSKASVRLSLKK